MNSQRTFLKTTLALLIALGLTGSSSFALSQKQIDATHRRALALQSVLELSAEQTDSLESLLIQTFESGQRHRKRFDDDYYALALENQKEMDSMRFRVNALLTNSQREQYRLLQKKSKTKYSSRNGEVLARRLHLDSSQAVLVDAILSYSEQDMREFRRKSRQPSGRSGGGFGHSGRRGAMSGAIAKLRKAHDDIEKVLTKDQKKEFLEYREEKMEELRPPDGDHTRGRNRGRGGGY